ncbi:MAG TPA: DUF2071 domain-containing protein [Abditibacteriaceae bacterium]|nr:DUF2071 domain-containing protein [Abditibacteriaceae bacterium]
MLHLLKRHPIPIEAFFRHSLVLTYALPRAVLEPLLPPGLAVDTYGDLGFLAIAMVQTEGLRPRGAPPFLGQNFFLTGYRIFTRFTTREGRHLRGLRILRSDTDKALMALGGNLLTHYHYRKAEVTALETAGRIEYSIRTPHAEADLDVCADLNSKPAPLPDGSPFPDLEAAREFAGPLPYTFDYEKETHSLILIKGVRKKWDPQPVRVQVTKNTFLEHEPFRSACPVLATAFHISNIPYRWERGRREPLEKTR